MRDYVNLVQQVLTEGEPRLDRTGVGTLSIFGGRIEFDLRQRFPLVTVKETRWRTAFLEMLWFLRGEPNTNWLNEHDCKLWDAWADADKLLGPVYGVQWRDWGGIDQIRELITGLRNNPTGRRHIVSAWNVGELGHMALPPCHWAFQCYVSNDGHLDMQVNQRSWDLALGAPFNIAQYALLLTLLGRAADLKPRRLAFSFGDAHLYLNHVDQMREVVKRDLHDWDGTRLAVHTDNTNIDGYRIDDFAIENYYSNPFVKLEVAV